MSQGRAGGVHLTWSPGGLRRRRCQGGLPAFGPRVLFQHCLAGRPSPKLPTTTTFVAAPGLAITVLPSTEEDVGWLLPGEAQGAQRLVRPSPRREGQEKPGGQRLSLVSCDRLVHPWPGALPAGHALHAKEPLLWERSC